MSLFPDDIRAKYEVLQKLGEGGIGQVFMVRHRQLDELRVVKVIHAHYADDLSVRKRFRREAKAATHLRHPNIAQIHDFHIGRDGRAYLVMELIEGLTVGQIIAHPRRLSVGLCLELGVQALDALGYLHSQAYAHRDVTPDNLMVTRSHDGRPLVKLIDLGLAKRQTETVQVTATNMFVGTVRYSSPERFRRPLSSSSDPSGDLYSLGIVLYELLTGVCPVRGTSFEELMTAHLLDAPPPFEDTDLDGRLNAELRRTLLKSLAKNPLERHRSAEEFAAELRLQLPSEPATDEELEDLFGSNWTRLASTADTDSDPRGTSMTTLASGRPDSTSDLVPIPELREAPEPTIRRPDLNRRAAAMPALSSAPARRRRVAYVGAAMVVALIVALGVMAVRGGVDWRGFGQELTGGSDPIVDAAAVPGPPAVLGQARVIVSARPWAEIASVLDAEGQAVGGLPGPLYTPTVLVLPAGKYRLELRHPDHEAPQFLDVQVPIVGTVRTSADFGAAAVDAFFADLGLTEALEGAGL